MGGLLLDVDQRAKRLPNNCLAFVQRRTAGGASKFGQVLFIVRSRDLLQVSTKFISHCGEELVLKIRLAARTEPFVESRGKNGHGHGFVDSSFDRPTSFARIGDAAGKI